MTEDEKEIQTIKEFEEWWSSQIRITPLVGKGDALWAWVEATRREREKSAELKRLLCIAYDYLKEHWEMDAAPLHEIKARAEEILKEDEWK